MRSAGLEDWVGLAKGHDWVCARRQQAPPREQAQLTKADQQNGAALSRKVDPAHAVSKLRLANPRAKEIRLIRRLRKD
jgi:hypothetical protein